MCGRKRDPKIDEQLKENKAEAEAAKDTAQADLKEAKADALEQAKVDAPSEEIVTEGQIERQGENTWLLCEDQDVQVVEVVEVYLLLKQVRDISQGLVSNG